MYYCLIFLYNGNLCFFFPLVRRLTGWPFATTTDNRLASSSVPRLSSERRCLIRDYTFLGRATGSKGSPVLKEGIRKLHFGRVENWRRNPKIGQRRTLFEGYTALHSACSGRLSGFLVPDRNTAWKCTCARRAWLKEANPAVASATAAAVAAATREDEKTIEKSHAVLA